MKKTVSVTLPASLEQATEKLDGSRSKAIERAVKSCAENTELLVRAFRLRLSMPDEEAMVKTTYRRDQETEDALKKLVSMTKLPGEQVVRLCLEAYVHKI